MTQNVEIGSETNGSSPEAICPKCQQANLLEAEVCEHCERHLQVFCRHCGHLNLRSNSRCAECRTQLHLPWPNRWKNARARRWIKTAEVVLLVLTVSLTYKGIVALSEFDLPQRPYTPPLTYVLKPDGTWHQQ
jgi:hypothetical protein